MLREGDTLLPMIFISDGTHLLNFARNKNEWPVCMPIGNPSSKSNQMPSMHSVVIVALLPIPINNRNISEMRLDEQRHTNRGVLNAVLRSVLQTLPIRQHPSAERGCYNVLCADGNFRHCKPVLQHGLHMAPCIATWISTSSMSIFRASVQRTNLQIMSLLISNTPSRITTYTECSVMPTPRQPMLNSRHAMFTENSTCFDIFLVLWVTSLNPTSSIQCRSACMTTSRSWFSTSWRHTNGSTSKMQSGYLCLLATTSHQKICHIRKFLHGMGRKWRRWASTCLELLPSLYEAEAPLSVPYSIAQLCAHGHC